MIIERVLRLEPSELQAHEFEAAPKAPTNRVVLDAGSLSDLLYRCALQEPPQDDPAIWLLEGTRDERHFLSTFCCGDKRSARRRSALADRELLVVPTPQFVPSLAQREPLGHAPKPTTLRLDLPWVGSKRGHNGVLHKVVGPPDVPQERPGEPLQPD